MKALFAAAAFAAATVAHAEAADPCVNFFAYVNQRWIDSTELPPDRARIGSFDALRIGVARLLEKELAQAAHDPAAEPTPGRRLVAADFAAGMDEAAIEARGLAALAPWLARIAALKSADELPALLGALARRQVAVPLQVYVSPDAKDKRRQAIWLRQGGLGLPDREDYFDDSERGRRLREAYRSYARRLLEGAGAAPEGDALDALMAFERRLAEAATPRARQRDPMASYNPHDAASLAALAPGFDWSAWLAAYAGNAGRRVIVGEPGFVRALAELAATAPPATWRLYLRVRLLDELAPRLPKRFEQAAFDFHDAAVRGLRQPPPRGERVVRQVGDSPAVEGLGELYVARAFSPKAQERALALVADLRAALRARIERLDWMSAPTKARALAKLDALAPKIGRPAEWRRYDGLKFAPDDFAGNALAAAEWQTAERLAELDRPVDRARWNVSPHIVNAFAGGLNDIVFPAAILQPPFFDDGADDATNYGAIGSVIGHEITHHFDDRGRRFDADGNLGDWWTEADDRAYRERVERVVALYGGYEPVPGRRIDGRLTLGENVSDLSGVQIAFDALQIAARRAGRTVAPAEAQRYFVAYATLWRSKQRVESLLNQLRIDPHSPGPFRVQGPLSNMPAFAAAFGCKAGAPMAATDPITVW
ncbi:MAG: M13 family metallopeptidase [Rubrivivax sp.]